MTSSYSCLRHARFSEGFYSLAALRFQDIMRIREWRNLQMEILRQNEILTEEDQIAYYKNFVKPAFKEEKPIQVLFSLLYGDECIGYGGLVHINWIDLRGEVSFLLSPERVQNPKLYRESFLHFLLLIKRVAFNVLHLNRIFTETYDIRPWHVSILEESGFFLEGRLREHLFCNGRYVDSLFHGFLISQWRSEEKNYAQ